MADEMTQLPEQVDMAEVRDLRRTAARYRDLMADLAAMCDDDWLRRRDRCMGLPGTSNRHDRDAAGAWEHAAYAVRRKLEEHGQQSDTSGSYLTWMKGDRDRGEAERAAEEADRG